jgi:hypothetical protein
MTPAVAGGDARPTDDFRSQVQPGNEWKFTVAAGFSLRKLKLAATFNCHLFNALIKKLLAFS